jgi:hypothetical protein
MKPPAAERIHRVRGGVGIEPERIRARRDDRKHEFLSCQSYHRGSSGISLTEGNVHPSLEEINPILPFRGFDDLLRISIEHIHRPAVAESRIR